MAEVINAVFENGVFKPLEKIEMKEKEVNGCVPCGPETCSMFQCSF